MNGLSEAEVAQRMRAGQVNRVSRNNARDYARIATRNLANWFNAMVTPAAVALFYLGEIQGAIAVSGMAIVNSTLGLVQEIRAKRHLDKLAILTETTARVLRAGSVHSIPAGEVVLDDIILLQTGDTIVADGPVVEAAFLEVDEALLTGESDPVRRKPGDALLSGSFCVAGAGHYRAEKVGADAFANRTSAEARRYHVVHSPMTAVINRIIQILTITTVILVGVYTVGYFVEGFPKTLEQKRDYVSMIAATITSMVPQGLVLTATFAFTLGAVVMSRRGAVVQRLNAVEAMAAIDVICTDKTGTLTTNRLHLETIQPCGTTFADNGARHLLQSFVSGSLGQENRTLQALKAGLGTLREVDVIDQIPFKSQNRYSAVRIRVDGGSSMLVLGAFEALRGRLQLCQDNDLPRIGDVVGLMQQAGQRVLIFAQAENPGLSEVATEQGGLAEIALRAVAVIGLSDELRPDVAEVLENLHTQGIQFKIISGDNPETVRGLVSHLCLPLADEPVVTGQQFAEAPDPAQVVAGSSVFGRVAPEQKVQIVESLQHAGFHVAMIGDGVNDVLSIKRANLGIAMGEGSQASKTVAGLVLENNNFALLPETLEEGRTIVRNLRRSSKLFLVKNVYSLMLILTYFAARGHIPFPYVPQQVTLLNWLVIGIPAFVIAMSRERSQSATKPRFLREVGLFALRTGIIFGLAGIAMLFIAVARFPGDESAQRTMLLSVLILLGITALLRALRDGEAEPLVGDRRFQLLGLLAFPVYLLAMYVPLAARFFELTPLGLVDWLIITATAAIAALLTLASDRILHTFR